jgi:alkanesulfonate monooxygenase SsuD/methylene tetrahydromethanopterin reductase-like flavin-dependent oxidoreductase (luciferase family)
MAGGAGRRQGDGYTDKTPNPLAGDPELVAEELRAYARAGVKEVQLVLDPITAGSIAAFAPILELLDRG